MKKGDFVKPKHNERSRYMNSEFRNWIELHKDDRFFVTQVIDGCARLAKVGFMITEDFLELVT